MDEKLFAQVVGQVMVHDGANWNPAGASSGLSTVRLIHHLPSNTFRIHAQKINDLKEVVLDSLITRDVRYNRPNDAFVAWKDSQAFWGLNFRRGSPDADTFFSSVIQVLRILNQNTVQQQNIASDMLAAATQQQQQQQQNSAALIQRSLQQQQIIQQQSNPQQQQQLIHNHQQQQQQAQAPILNQGPPAQVMQQPPNLQLLQQQQQQQQLQQYVHHTQPAPAVAPPQQPNHLPSINNYQPQQQPHLQQQQQPPVPQQQQHNQIPQHQIAPAAPQAAPAPPPPPPPPPPPAQPAAVAAAPITNSNARNNGTSNLSQPSSNHVGGVDNRNGGSPSNQASSLASELASKCQMRKVNLSRSDSDKESECNNNIANAKTTRAASLALTDNLMNDLNKKLASRRERIDQQGDSKSNANSNGNMSSLTNGISASDKEGWLADLIRQEVSKAISKEMSKMTAEIIDALRTELRQR